VSLYDPVPGGGITMRPIRLTEEAGLAFTTDEQGNLVRSSEVPPVEPKVVKARTPRSKKATDKDASV
jgi:hypothetical protein